MAEPMKIAQDCVVTIDYTLTDDAGTIIDSSSDGEPLTYLHGHSQIIPGLEKALEGKVKGEKHRMHVPAAEGYGDHDPEKVFTEPRDRFDFEVEAGQILQAHSEEGETLTFQVVEVSDEGVKLDGNHPLAGKNLNFDVTVLDVRAASIEELKHGHAHSGDGHHH
jgi:FKBP-type peptidyl-prolyl cis-trans isomerase SlyD